MIEDYVVFLLQNESDAADGAAVHAVENSQVGKELRGNFVSARQSDSFPSPDVSPPFPPQSLVYPRHVYSEERTYVCTLMVCVGACCSSYAE